ncbi:hypothetical protein CHS0354_036008 [Potamilus streckersoni]|uniref:Uncharacterized protein n=1 Tax=Potamilus streckersoni TaxID=2493646 RepID=A0AAE0RMS9_9BIVA|nr:hypothetical protein CHS0354_036008 [Potamilus streckersoni]
MQSTLDVTNSSRFTNQNALRAIQALGKAQADSSSQRAGMKRITLLLVWDKIEGITYDIAQTEDIGECRQKINRKRNKKRKAALLRTSDHSIANSGPLPERQLLPKPIKVTQKLRNFNTMADTQKRGNTN